MRISAVRLCEMVGELEFEGEFWEERLVMPLDVYQPYRDEHRASHRAAKVGKYEMRSVFLRIETDDGVYGIGGPATHEQAYIIATQMARYLVGQDPFAIELIWDTIYRAQIHGRKGPSMMALSVVDCALWDLKGKALNQPVYRLLGGPTRETIPAYASALGYSVTPERAAERAAQLKQDGWKATKWFFRHGPGSGKAGIEKNVEMVRALRTALGSEIDLMLDAWNSWDLPYAIQVGKRIAQFEPRWVEEPTLPDKINVYAEIRRALNAMGIPVSGGEHEYTRWGLKLYMDAGAVDVLQPDPPRPPPNALRSRCAGARLLVRRHHRDAEDRRSGQHLRPPDDPARPFDSRHLPRHRLAAAQPLPAAGVPHQMEHRAPVLLEDAGAPRARRGACLAAGSARHRHGAGRSQDPGAEGARILITNLYLS